MSPSLIVILGLPSTPLCSVVRTIFAVVLKALGAGISRLRNLEAPAIHKGWRLKAVDVRFDKFLDVRAEGEWSREGVDVGLRVARGRARRAGEREVAVTERESIVLASKRDVWTTAPQDKNPTMANPVYSYRK